MSVLGDALAAGVASPWLWIPKDVKSNWDERPLWNAVVTEAHAEAVEAGKQITVVALDYDRCGKMMTNDFYRPAAFNTRDLAVLLNETHSANSSHILLVSFSNRQSDTINSYYTNGPRANLDHLEGALLILKKMGLYIPSSVDARYFLEEEMSALEDKAAFKAFVQADKKRTLAAKIRATYPHATKFVFLDDEFENLPPPEMGKVYTVHFSPGIQPLHTVKYNQKAF